jgi:hypothetical protein
MVKMTLEIKQNSSNPSKIYKILEDEELFLASLIEQSNKKGLKPTFNFTRLLNGTINVDFKSYFVGKIKLQGRTTSMLVMKNIYDSMIIKGSLADYIEGIDTWIRYIKKHLI